MESSYIKDIDGSEIWMRGPVYHREDGPAVIRPLGSKIWYINGQLHRADGPAIEWYSGGKQWYFNGKHLGHGDEGFWNLWNLLTDEQRNNTDLLYYLPGAR